MTTTTPIHHDHHILSHADYLALRAHWRTLMAARTKLGPEYHLLYASLLGRDWRQGLTAPTNAKKIANGAMAGWVGGRVYHLCSAEGPRTTPYWVRFLAPFGGIVTVDHLTAVAARLPATPRRWDQYWQEAHDGTHWLIPVYREPADA